MLHLSSPAWLILIGVLPFVVWANRHTLTSFERRQRQLQIAIRSLAIVLLALALAQPVWSRAGLEQSVVYLVDVSASISPAEIVRAADWIDAAHRRRTPDHFAVVAAGRTVRRLPGVDELRTLQTEPMDEALSSATNLEQALLEARGFFAPHHLRRLVVFTDGRPTTGDVVRAAAMLREEGIAIDTVPLDARNAEDAWIDRVEVPERIVAGEPFLVDVELASQAALDGEVVVLHRGRALVSRHVRLQPGSTGTRLEVSVTDPGPAVLEVVLRSPLDRIAQNNSLHRSVTVLSRPSVLYVESRQESARYLRGALEAAAIDVTVSAPARAPATVDALDSFDAVILSDVGPGALPGSTLQALAAYVTDRGGGLVMTGGPSVFGERGYSGTPLEDILPVTFDVKEPPDEVAVLMVVDKSWSMKGRFIELAKEACKAAVDVLQDDDLVGVVAFNDRYDWPVRLQPAANRAQIRTQISGIQPGGHTVMYPALQDAYQALKELPAPTKHVILLSDGRTYVDPFEALVTDMARARITVSTVAVGKEADRELLENIARWGRGRAYAVDDARRVPQIFIKEAEQVVGRALDERPVRAVARQPSAFAEQSGIAGAPTLLGYSRVRARDQAETLLETSARDGDPLLVRWQHGLGRTVMFASDARDRWAANWLRWRGYGAFWVRIVRDVLRRPEVGGGLSVERVHGADGRAFAKLTFDAIDRAGRFVNLADVQADVAGGSASQRLQMRQTAPGRYEGSLEIEEGEAYLARIRFDAQAPPLARGLALEQFLPPGPLDEYRFRPADTDLLRTLAGLTHGRFDPPPDSIPDSGPPTRVPTRLWPFLLACALPVFLADLLLRRIRLFERPA